MNPRSLGTFRQYIAAIIASIGVIIGGTFLGWSSPVLYIIIEKEYPFKMSSNEISWMVSILYIGNIISPLPSGLLMDKIGRKISLLLLTLLPIITWVLIYFAKEPYMLYVARLLAGMYLGIVTTITPMYLAEIAEPSVRGSLSTLFQLTINIGVLFVYVVGPWLSYENLAILCGTLPVIFLLTFSFMPESPYFFLTKGYRDKAGKSLKWFRGYKNVEDITTELDYLQNSVEDEISRKKNAFNDLFKSRSNRKALLISTGLAYFQRMSGISVVTAFTAIALPKQGAGILNVDQCVIIMGGVWIIGVVLVTFLVDLVGRKPLLLLSSVGCSLSMFCAGLWYFFYEKTSNDVSNIYYIPFIFFLLYGLSFCLGIGPIVFTIQGEMFPSYMRGLASGIVSEVLALTSFITNKLYNPIGDSIGYYLNYWIFSANSFFAIFFIIFVVIETKRKTLIEIQFDLRRHNF